MGDIQSESDLVFLPLNKETLQTFAIEGSLEGSLRAFAVTPLMLEAFGLTTSDTELADFTAVNIAAIAGLLSFGERLVAVIPSSYLPSRDDFGEVSVSGLKYDQVVSLFADERGDQRIGEIAKKLSAVTLDAAWEDPRITELVDEADLLWYGPDEWQQLI